MRCKRCGHKPHTGLCTARSGGTAYACNCVHTTLIVTGDTITDDMIVYLYDHRAITADLAVETGAKLPGGQWYAPDHVRKAARTSCAETWNRLHTNH